MTGGRRLVQRKREVDNERRDEGSVEETKTNPERKVQGQRDRDFWVLCARRSLRYFETIDEPICHSALDAESSFLSGFLLSQE